MEQEIHRDIGRMESELTSLRTLVAEMRKDLKEIREELLMIRGGYKTLLAVAATIGAAISAIGEYFLGKFGH